jgi:hypothetical protein
MRTVHPQQAETTCLDETGAEEIDVMSAIRNKG